MRYAIDGKDVLNVFGSENGKEVLRYLMKSYYHITSYVKNDAYETALNEGKRAVVIDLLDKLSADCPKEANQLLAEIELL